MGVDRVFIKRFLDKYGIQPQIFAREVGCCWYLVGPRSHFTSPQSELLTRTLIVLTRIRILLVVVIFYWSAVGLY